MEIWQYIPNYEGLYMVSNKGRIKSMGAGKNSNAKESILKPWITNGGYYVIELCKNGIYKKWLLHRLIAITFIKNEFNKPQVNHKNGLKTDNRTKNLEWVTRSENMKHACANKLLIPPSPWKGKMGKNNPTSKTITQLNENGDVINDFFGTKEASRITGISQGNISAAALGVRKSAGGFIWRYKI